MKNKIIILLISTLILIQCKKEGNNVFAGGFPGGTYDTLTKSLQEIPELKVNVIASNGSLDNINLLLDKKAEFALTQVDMYYSAKLGNSAVAKEINILLPMLEDEIHLVVNNSIKSTQDLKGKKIAIGHSVSGIKATSISVLRLCGIDFSEIETIELGPEEALPKLLKQEIDAVFVVSGLPVKILSELPENAKDKIKILNIESSILNQIKEGNKVYQKSTIPANTYSWQKDPIQTLQVQTVLIARKDLPKEKVSTFLKSLFLNLENLTKVHPEWNGLDKKILKEKSTTLPDFFNPVVIENLN
ncbi:MAG: TAXI family TRAP transporter solute-binding subunit [Leptospiraceae bacterium]|nr:TAXI family TRAP transporter solute-binding subunit [Leptospiraceae bacterium]